jgi:hypothetical protein
MEDLRQLRAEVLAQNQDLDDEAREQLIEEISSEVRANLNARMRRLSQEQRG